MFNTFLRIVLLCNVNSYGDCEIEKKKVKPSDLNFFKQIDSIEDEPRATIRH